MMRTSALLGILLVGLAGASGAVVAADSAGAVCEAVGESGHTAVGVTPTETLGPDETITLYPGSELQILVCEDDEALAYGDDWSLADPDGSYDIEDETDRRVRITVTDADGLDLAEHVEGVDLDGQFAVESPGNLVYESELLGSDVQLSDTAHHSTLDDREGSFVRATEDVDDLIESLEGERPALSTDPDKEQIAEYRAELEALRDAEQDALDETAAFEHVLYEQALNHPQPENAIASMSALEREQKELEDETAAVAENSVTTLEEIEGELQATVRQNVGLGFAGGLVAGIVIGVIGPWRKGKEVDDFYQVSSKNTFTTDVLKLPWLVGAVLLVGGLGAMVVLGVLGVIV